MNTLIKVLFLSSAFVGGLHATHASERPRFNDRGACIEHCNPFSGAQYFSIEMAKEDWGPQPAVPFANLWDNEIKQTAQQMAAVCSYLQFEGFRCDDLFHDPNKLHATLPFPSNSDLNKLKLQVTRDEKALELKKEAAQWDDLIRGMAFFFICVGVLSVMLGINARKRPHKSVW